MEIEMSEEDYIMHYGVKGMKWGVRKKRKSLDYKRNRNKNYSDSYYRKDKYLYGKGVTKRINKRMNKGMTHLEAENAEAKRQVGILLASTAASIVVTSLGVAAINRGADRIHSLNLNQNYDWGKLKAKILSR